MPDAKQPGRWWRRKAKAPTRTWTYRCYVDCADEVVGWATGRPGFKVRVSREKGGWPVVVTLRGPAGAVLPEADGGIVAGWGVTAPWHPRWGQRPRRRAVGSGGGSAGTASPRAGR